MEFLCLVFKTHNRTTDELIFSGLTGKTLFDFDMKELNSIGVVFTWTNDEDVKSYETRFINEIGFGSIGKIDSFDRRQTS